MGKKVHTYVTYLPKRSGRCVSLPSRKLPSPMATMGEYLTLQEGGWWWCVLVDFGDHGVCMVIAEQQAPNPELHLVPFAYYFGDYALYLGGGGGGGL